LTVVVFEFREGGCTEAEALDNRVHERENVYVDLLFKEALTAGAVTKELCDRSRVDKVERRRVLPGPFLSLLRWPCQSEER
jgi:hypothetical protein